MTNFFDDGHWFEWVLPWEEPSWWHPIRKLRWRERHSRIRTLEASLSTRWNFLNLPWEDPYGGWA